MSEKRFRKSDGSVVVIKNGRITGNEAGAKANAPTPIDSAVAALVPLLESDPSETPPGVADLHQIFTQYREDEDFLAPATGDDIVLAQSEMMVPKELNTAARNLIGSLGMSRENDDILHTVIQNLGLNRDTRIAPAEEAAASLAALYPTDEVLGNKTIESIRSGRALLTYSEIAILRGVKDEVDARQQLSYLSPLDSSDEWIPTVEQRHCTICGQFVGALGSHNCGFNQIRDAVSELYKSNKVKEQSVKIDALGKTGDVEEKEVTFRLLKGLEDIPAERLQDLYLATHAQEAGHIVMGFYAKPLLGQGRIKLPAKLRAAVVERPSSSLRLDVLAETIDPPFEKHEIARILDSCSPEGCEELLSSPKAREHVVYVLSNSPTEVGTKLSVFGRLPQEVLVGMASCGDQAVRRQAAVAPNLGPVEAEMLSTDPDVDVRAALLYGSKYETPYTSATSFVSRLLDSGIHNDYSPVNRDTGGMFYSNVTRYPHLLTNYVNDPDEGLALGALSNFPYSRHSLQAIGQVTSRKRLEAIDRNLDVIWPYLESSDEKRQALGQHTLGHIRGVEDLLFPEHAKYRARNFSHRMGSSSAEAEEGRRQVKRLIAARLQGQV